MNAQPRRALDTWPWPLKKPLYPVIIGKRAAGKDQEVRPAKRRAFPLEPAPAVASVSL